MSDLIDRAPDYADGFADGYKAGIRDAEPKKGRWIIVTIGETLRSRGASIYKPIYKCSRCGMPIESYIRFDKPRMPEDADFPRYCPNCGAKMEVTE